MRSTTIPQQTQVFHALQRRRVKRAGAWPDVAFFSVTKKESRLTAGLRRQALPLLVLRHLVAHHVQPAFALHDLARVAQALPSRSGPAAVAMRSGFEGEGQGRDRGGGGDATAGVTPRARGSRDGRNGGARRDARVSGAARRAGRAARTYLHRDARGGAWTPGAGVDTGRASLGLTRRAAVRARHRARQILDKIAASRVNDFARSGEPPVFTGITPSSRSASRTRDRASTSSTARARALAARRWRAGTRHATRTLERARAHRSMRASPTYRRHDFPQSLVVVANDGFASSITGASSFVVVVALDRAPSAPSVFARLGTHRAPRTSPHRRS